MQAKIDSLSGHIILCGYGRMGSMATKILKGQGIDLVVIEEQEALRSAIHATGALCVIGDATEEEVLKKAGIERAHSLVTALSNDAANVYVTLTARGMQPGLHIVGRAEQPSAEQKLKRAGADRVICPSNIGASRIADILTKPNVVDFFEVAAQGVDLEMDEYTILPTSPFRDKTIMEADFRQKTGAMIIAIKRADGTSLLQPDPDETLRAGDQVIIVGPAGTSGRIDQLL